MPTTSFTFSGGYQFWKVPTNVTEVTVTCLGAGSGANQGGRVTGKLKVTPGKTLTLICGQQGSLHSGQTGGSRVWGGGGAGGRGQVGNGGNGGGGYSAVRRDSATGTICCVAGGAGGDSGDVPTGGNGGAGGGPTGGSGRPGTSGSNSTQVATGGTQTQGGNGGTSSSGSQFNGQNATDTILAAYGGTGGGPNSNCHGGGGGGGGYHQGGGGQAASLGYAPGGGGGGGSNYVGLLTSSTSTRGDGGTGHGNITITWNAPPPANQRPNTPGTAKINGKDDVTGTPTVTRSTGSVSVSALVSDPDGDKCLLLVRLSPTSSFATYSDHKSGFVNNNTRATVTLTGLKQNTLYYARLYAQDGHGLYSSGYNAIAFWTNRPPDMPGLTSPVDNASVPAAGSTVFTWSYTDPDSSLPSNPDRVTGWEFMYRTAATVTKPAGPWTVVSRPASTSLTWTLNPGDLKGSTYYEWTVRTKDTQGAWGPWALSHSFFATSTTAPPILLAPVNAIAVDVHEDLLFSWKFINPSVTATQTKADLRYRVVGQSDAQWITLSGDLGPGVPGSDQFWNIQAGTFAANENYEWQVRAYDTVTGHASDWSDSALFWTISTPGDQVAGQPVVISDLVLGALGCGTYRAFIYSQGGQQQLGEITPLTSVTFGRVRDDISTATVVSNGFGQDCCRLYADTHTWMHELVLFRDGKRVWEGPLTLLTFEFDQVTFEAKDVMAYVYRRIMRQGYNDTFQKVNPALPYDSSKPDANKYPPVTVVQRALSLIVNALAPHDPNVIPYLTTFEFADDARESRIVPDYSRTAWEEVDDLAATAGLDYTVVGRRIILSDTHRPIGRLLELRDGDFSDHPIVTEYGMQLSNYSAVTNGSGVWGAATPENETIPFQSYGPVEMLSSAYGEAASPSTDVVTQADLTAQRNLLAGQAARNIAHRWPAPVIVRIPDNSSLSPDVNIDFDQLVPGVWVPLRSEGTCRTVVQWQKLDSVTVTAGPGTEQVGVTLSPAPNQGQDPDADTAAAGDGG